MEWCVDEWTMNWLIIFFFSPCLLLAINVVIKWFRNKMRHATVLLWSILHKLHIQFISKTLKCLFHASSDSSIVLYLFFVCHFFLAQDVFSLLRIRHLLNDVLLHSRMVRHTNSKYYLKVTLLKYSFYSSTSSDIMIIKWKVFCSCRERPFFYFTHNENKLTHLLPLTVEFPR